MLIFPLLLGDEWFASPRSVHASLGVLFSMVWVVRDVGRHRETTPTDLTADQELSTAGHKRSAEDQELSLSQVRTFHSTLATDLQVRDYIY